MPKKKANRDFLIAGYRRIAQAKNPSALQLRALNYLAYLTGNVKVLDAWTMRDPVNHVRKAVIPEIMTVDAPPDLAAEEAARRTLQYLRQEESHAAASSDSPSGQPEVRSDGSTD